MGRTLVSIVTRMQNKVVDDRFLVMVSFAKLPYDVNQNGICHITKHRRSQSIDVNLLWHVFVNTIYSELDTTWVATSFNAREGEWFKTLMLPVNTGNLQLQSTIIQE